MEEIPKTEKLIGHIILAELSNKVPRVTNTNFLLTNLSIHTGVSEKAQVQGVGVDVVGGRDASCIWVLD